MASVGPPNIPSARTLRSVGLRYLMSDMRGVEGPFKGASTANGPSLYPGAPIYDSYPRGP